MNVLEYFREKRAERQTRLEEKQRETEHNLARERFEKAKNDLEHISHTALMQRSPQCFTSKEEFKDELTIDGAKVELKSSGNPWRRQRYTKVKVTSPNKRITLIEFWSHRAERTDHKVIVVP